MISQKQVWTGRVISAVPALMLLSGGVIAALKLVPSVVESFLHLGYPESVVPGIGVVQIACAVLYIIPRTSIWGALLMTAYLGGATATHVRVGEPFYAPVVVGVLVWAGLVLRNGKLRELLFGNSTSSDRR